MTLLVSFVVESALFNITAKRKLIPVRVVEDKISHPIHPVSRLTCWFRTRRSDFSEIAVDLVTNNIRVAASARAVIAGRANVNLTIPDFQAHVRAYSERLRKSENIRIKPHRGVNIVDVKNGNYRNWLHTSERAV